MKQIRYTAYGTPDVMQRMEVEQPKPDKGEVLIKVKAAGINELDWKIRSGNLKMQDGKDFPKLMGCELAGEVAALGEGVEGFAVGDAVFGWIPFSKLGAFAEYAVTQQDLLWPKPASLSFAEAAALPMAGTTALQALTKEVSLAPGKKVLINGATGGVGHFAVQIAHAHGAEVTAVAGTEHVEFAKKLGADVVVDYHERDIKESSDRYDVILDTSKKLPWEAGKKLLKEHGTYLDLQPGLKAFIGSFLQNAFSSKEHDVLGVEVKQADLKALAALIEDGQLAVSVDRVFDFSEAVSAIASIEDGSVSIAGKAVLSMDSD